MAEWLEDDRFQHIAGRIDPQGRLVRAWSLEGGISAGMTALEIERPDGETSRYIVRQPSTAALRHNPRVAQDEYQLLLVMQGMGMATPTPLYLDESGEVFPAPYLVIGYVEGRPDFAPAHLPDFCLHLATHLARIHLLAGDNADLAFLPAAGQIYTLSPRPVVLNAILQEGRIRDALEPVWPLTSRNAPVLVHGDFWPGNVLWRDGRIAAVIDWEDASLGDPLIDLAIGRLDLLWIYGSDAMDTFTRRYVTMAAIDTTDLPYWDLYAALRLIRLAGADLAAWASYFTSYGRTDITEHTIREHVSGFVAQALEKVNKTIDG